MGIIIQNKLEILPSNKIRVPGCEPISEFTSTTLSQNMVCNNSEVDLSDVLIVIPDATIESQYLPLRRYLVLPEGPPSKYGCTDCAHTDWYKLIRDIPKVTTTATKAQAGCDAFTWSGCVFEQLFK